MALGRFSYDFSNKPPDTLSGVTGTSANPLARTQTARTSTRSADLPSFSFDSLSGDPAEGPIQNPAGDTPPPAPEAPGTAGGSWDSPGAAPGSPWSLSVEQATPGAAPAPQTSASGTSTAMARFNDQMRALQTATDPNQQAIAKDRLARDLYTSLQQDGHDVKWQGDQLLVDGRPYAVGAGVAPGTAASATAGAQPGTSTNDVGGTLSTRAAQTTAAAATPRPTGERVDPARTGSLEEATAYLQQQAQKILGRQLTQDELNLIAANVGYQGPTTSSAQPTPNHRPATEQGTTDQAIAYVQQEAQRMLGRQLTDAELQQAIGISGYSGAGPVTGDQVNRVLDAIAAQAPPQETTTGGGLVTGDQMNRALDILESWWTDPGGNGPPIDPGPQQGPPGTNFPNGSGGRPYEPGEITFDDLRGMSIDEVLARLPDTSQLGPGALDARTKDLVLSVLQNPESLDPATVAKMKAKAADDLAEMSVFQDDEIKRFGYATGNSDSNWIASERVANRRDRDRSLIESNRDIDIEAAQTNFQDRLSAAGLGSSVAGDQRRLSIEEQAAQRENVALATDTALRASALTGDRLALREQVNAKAAELGIQADELQLKWVLGQMADMTDRYGIDVGAAVDREQLAQQDRQFLEDLSVKFAQLQFQYDELEKRDQWFGAGLGLDWWKATSGAAGTGGGPLPGTF
ncbi:MAG: hypothetical protein AB7O67_23245 [Vicinamibacterales bacterium]